MVDYDSESSSHFEVSSKSDFAFIDMRIGFTRKVYSVLSAQLLLTFLLSLISVYTDFGVFQLNYPILMIFSSVILVAILLTLLFCRHGLLNFPINLLTLFIFTICEAYSISYIVTLFSSDGQELLMLISVGITMGMTVGLTIYAYMKQVDITTWNGFFFSFSFGLLLLAIAGGLSFLTTFEVAICLSIITLIGTYIVFDTQLIMGGKRYQLTVDDYIVAALALYLDVVVLFLEILRLLSLTED